MSPRRPSSARFAVRTGHAASRRTALAAALGGALFSTGCNVAVDGGGEDDARSDAAGGSAIATAPFGSWASPIAAADLAKAAVSTSDVRV
ncbi:MAG: hypothetical protein ACRC2H_01965, partial [Silanimonas sp.]